jgi:hypothetical protein
MNLRQAIYFDIKEANTLTQVVNSMREIDFPSLVFFDFNVPKFILGRH